MNRRHFIRLGASACAAGALTGCSGTEDREATADALISARETERDLKTLRPVVAESARWSGRDFDRFVDTLSTDQLKLIFADDSRIGMPEGGVDFRNDGSLREGVRIRAKEVCGFINTRNGHWFSQPMNYHDDLLIPTGRALGLQDAYTPGSLALEQRILEKVAENHWDSMTAPQRRRFLHLSDWELNAAQRAAMIAGTGAVFIATLAACVTTAGFAFYTGMSSAMAGLAASVGTTLSFATYAGASVLVSALTGVVALSITLMAAIIACGLYAFTRARQAAAAENLKGRLALLTQFHVWKIGSLRICGDPVHFGQA